MPRKFKATSTPNVAPSNIFEPMEQTIGQDAPRVVKSTGDAREAISPAVIEPVDRPMAHLDSEKMAMMAFMNEEIDVHIHSVQDKNAEQIFELFINGQREVFRRNERKKVKRRFVDLLARLKPTTFTHREVTSSEGGRDVVYDQHTGLRYPFSVMNDPHPRGADWLRSVLNEG